MNIIDLLHIKLQATHRSENIKVSFPPMHFLIEELGSDILATCIEYTQAYQSSKIESAVAGLIDNMFDYFFTTIRVLGKDALHEIAADPASNAIWSEIKKAVSLKHDLDFAYIEKVFKSSSLSDTEKNQLFIRNGGIVDQYESETREEHIRHLQSDIIDSLKLSRMNSMGSEGADEWIIDIDRIGIQESPFLAGVI